MHMNRRSLITGLISLVAAPAIVRATSLMPVRALVETPPLGLWIYTMAGVTVDGSNFSFQSGWREVGWWHGLELPPHVPRWSHDTAYNIGDLVRG